MLNTTNTKCLEPKPAKDESPKGLGSYEVLRTEQRVIAALLHQPQLLAKLNQADHELKLTGDDFSNHYYRVLMTLVDEFAQKGFQRLDQDVIWNKLNMLFALDSRKEDADNWENVLNVLWDMDEPAGDELLFFEHCKTVATASLDRKLGKALTELSAERADKHPDPHLLLAKFCEAGEKLQVNASTIKLIGDIERANMEYRAEKLALVRLRCPTGFQQLDGKINGFYPGRLYMLAARPGMGKTTLGLNLMLNIATNPNTNFPVLVISLELNANQLWEWALCKLAQRTADQLDALSVQDLNEITTRTLRRQRGRDAPVSMLQICHRLGGLTMYDLRGLIVKAVASFGGLSAVMIDFVQLLEPNEQVQGVNRDRELGAIVSELKKMAQSFKLPFLVLSQLNRNIESHRRRDSRPVLSDLRESGRLEITADVVMLLHRQPEQDPNKALLIIGKNRFGATGDVQLSCQLDRYTFY